MQTKNFKLIMTLFILFLMAAIVSLATILFINGPRVRLVNFDKDPSNTSLHENSLVRIVFDRPIEDVDYTDQISFVPEIKFTAETSAQAILLRIENNFNSEQEYKLRVNDDIYDKSGKKMKEPYTYSFNVGAPRYVFIERNYDENTSSRFPNSQDNTEDHIKLGKLREEPEILFSHPEIIMFSANSEYIAVTVKEDEYDEIYTVNLKNSEVRKENMPSKGRISNLSVGTFGSTSLYSITADESFESTESFEQNSYKLEFLNLETGEIKSLKNSEDKSIQAYSIELDKFGQVALIQDAEQNFFAVSPYGNFNPIILGSKTSTYGFNSSGTEILFRDFDDIVSYDIASSEFRKIDFSTNNFINKVIRNNTGTYFSYNVFSSNQTTSYIEKKDSNDEENRLSRLWLSEDGSENFATDFSVSFDGKILAIQESQKNCIYDVIGANNQCKTSLINIHSIETNDSIDTFRGINLTWLP